MVTPILLLFYYNMINTDITQIAGLNFNASTAEPEISNSSMKISLWMWSIREWKKVDLMRNANMAVAWMVWAWRSQFLSSIIYQLNSNLSKDELDLHVIDLKRDLKSYCSNAKTYISCILDWHKHDSIWNSIIETLDWIEKDIRKTFELFIDWEYINITQYNSDENNKVKIPWKFLIIEWIETISEFVDEEQLDKIVSQLKRLVVIWRAAWFQLVMTANDYDYNYGFKQIANLCSLRLCFKVSHFRSFLSIWYWIKSYETYKELVESINKPWMFFYEDFEWTHVLKSFNTLDKEEKWFTFEEQEQK